VAIGASLLAGTNVLCAQREPPPSTAFLIEPRIVGPGVVSTPAEEFKATVAPDGKTLVYTITDHLFRHMTIVEAARRGSGWAAPGVVPFSGVWRDGDPAFAPDGRSLLFISNRPLPGDSAGTIRRDYNIWRIARRTNGSWGRPVALGREVNTDSSEFAPSFTTTGVLYFSRGPRILRATPASGGFAAPEVLPFEGGDPAVAADERFLLFDADGPTPGDADLFFSCHGSTGWTAPRRLDGPVNSTFQEGDPAISADGRMLYFFSERYTRAIDRAPRPRRATYTEVAREARSNIYNGSRNLYQLDISTLQCPARY
jgi:Tol biopolymer transport system component